MSSVAAAQSKAPTGRHRSAPGWARTASLLAVVTGVEAILASLGLVQGEGAFNVAPVWPAAGFAVAVTFIYGYRVLPGIAVGESLASTLFGTPLLVNAPLAVLAAAVGALGAWSLHRWAPNIGEPQADAREAIKFLALAGGLTAGCSGALGAGGLVLLSDLPASAFWSIAGTWWLGDAVGIVVFAPFILVLLLRWREARKLTERWPEATTLLAATAAAGGLGFAGDPVASFPAFRPEYAVLPFLVWGSLRFGLCGGSTCNVAMTLALTGAAVGGMGPLGAGDGQAAYSLQFLLGILGATNLVLAATVDRRNQLQREARREADFLQAVADKLPGAMFRRHLTPEGHLHYPFIAGRLADEYGLQAGERSTLLDDVDDGPAERAGELDPRDRAGLRDALLHSARTLEPVEIDLRICGPDGVMRWGRSISRPTAVPDGGVVWDGILLDITHEKEQQQRVEFLARHDPLTGLLNRNGFQDAVAPMEALARRRRESLAFCMLDLDGFKEINDTYGHGIGDRVLEAVADRVRSETRFEDVKARLGGDEFLVVQLTGAERRTLEATCRRLLDALSRSVRVREHLLQPAVSMGVAFFPDDGTTREGVMAGADQALYLAKKRDRGNLVFYSPEIRTPPLYGNLQLGQDLAQAIDQGDLEVYYQPQIALETGQVTGIEALARWRHPERGLIPPSEFVGLAENRGLATALDIHILRRALADLTAWDNQAPSDLRLAVNLSGASVRDHYQRQAIASAVAEAGIAGERLEIELTESTLVQAPDERVGHALTELSQLGIRFAVDDFGTGYGSLTYLRLLPVDRIKIDRSFVQGAPYTMADTEIVRALIQLGANLGLSVIAEGVETGEHLDAARGLGCTDIQGYYFAHPMPARELLAFLDRKLQAKRC